MNDGNVKVSVNTSWVVEKWGLYIHGRLFGTLTPLDRDHDYKCLASYVTDEGEEIVLGSFDSQDDAKARVLAAIDGSEPIM